MRYLSLFLTPVCAISASAQTHPLLERSPMFDVNLGNPKKVEELCVQLVKLVPRLNNWRSLSYTEEQKLREKMLPNRFEIESMTATNPELKKQLRKELYERLWDIYVGWPIKSVTSLDIKDMVNILIPQ